MPQLLVEAAQSQSVYNTTLIRYFYVSRPVRSMKKGIVGLQGKISVPL